MALNRLSYQHKIFLLIMGYSWLLVMCFVGFQYLREKEYRAGTIDEQLQIYNRGILDALANGTPVENYVKTQPAPFSKLRVSVIATDGTPIFDNGVDSLPKSNHLDRPEIHDAIAAGIGHTVRRRSATTDEDYFYSAMTQGNLIVRSAAPYDVSLVNTLDADKGFLWFMLGVTLIVSVLGWLSARKIGHTISRLSAFARKAENGEEVYGDEAFPHDELGEISRHIVGLYAAQQRQHAEILYQESEKTRIKKQLTNNINHELKTPVAAMYVCLETLLERPDLTQEKAREIIERCFANAVRLRSLLNDVSILTRLDDGQSTIAKERLSLGDVIDSVVKEFNYQTDMEIGVDKPHDVIMQGNRHLLESVFRNLISNSLAYSQGTRIDIRISGPYTVTFADNGIGIHQEHLSRIFERFYRIDKGRSRDLGGTGLGLSIVKNAITFHGGSITATNREGGGLLFTIQFQ